MQADPKLHSRSEKMLLRSFNPQESLAESCESASGQPNLPYAIVAAVWPSCDKILCFQHL